VSDVAAMPRGVVGFEDAQALAGRARRMAARVVVLGHEGAGVVEAVGEGAASPRPTAASRHLITHRIGLDEVDDAAGYEASPGRPSTGQESWRLSHARLRVSYLLLALVVQLPRSAAKQRNVRPRPAR
jgi:hypothetical protein